MFIIKFYWIPLSEGRDKAQNEVDMLHYLNMYVPRI